METSVETIVLAKQDIHRDVAQIIANCVVIDAKQLKLQLSLIDDVGMDSLDFLDVVFALEKQFSIKFRHSKFEQLLRLDLLQDNLQDNNNLIGHISLSDINQLRPYLPALALRESNDTTISAIELFSLITVESLVIAIDELLVSGSDE